MALLLPVFLDIKITEIIKGKEENDNKMKRKSNEKPNIKME